MRAYSIDLRERVLQDCQEGLSAAAVAAKYRVSASWVRRLKQRHRERGEIAPRQRTRWRLPLLAPHVTRLETLILERPDRTLAELREALGTTVSLATVWRAVNRLGYRLTRTPERVRSRAG